ncbi:MAG: hypothetical protein AAF587_08005 [Bacteroidota bacterium]
MNTAHISFWGILFSVLLGFSCSSTAPASVKKTKAVLPPPQTVEQHLQRLPGLRVSGNTISYRGGRPLIVLNGAIVSYNTLRTMVAANSIKSVKLLKSQTDIKRWTNSNVTGVIEVRSF